MSGPGVVVLGDRLLVERLPAPERIGGLFVPDRARWLRHVGRVVSVGVPNAWMSAKGMRPSGLLPGDVVMWGKYSGVELELDERPYTILGVDEVLAVFQTEEEKDFGTEVSDAG